MSRVTLATMYGVGLSPRAPGTAGSLVAALLAWAVLMLPYGAALLALGVVVFTILGTRSSARYMAAHGAHDPGEIVVDELAGQWLTYSIWHGWLLVMAGHPSANAAWFAELTQTPGYIALGFVLFRLFDIVKPWPISVADAKVKTPFGVMLDDLLAAIPAGTLLYVCYLLSPLMFGQMESVYE